jgi:cell wall assembly regulator SMI1
MRIPELVDDRLQDCFAPIHEDDIRALEAELNATFPRDYFEFLLRYNGGYLQHPVAFRVRDPGPFVDEVSFEDPYGIIKERPWDERSSENIRFGIATFAGRIPDHWVPIARSGGDLICVSLSADNYGKVFVWDSVDEGEENNTYLAADSFTEFLGCLYVDSELEEEYVETLPVFQAVERGKLGDVAEYLADGGKVDCRNEHGHTLLMCAARTSWPKIVRVLLDQGAQPNACDRDDYTPLYHAAMRQTNDSVKLLLEAGADARFCDYRGRTLVKLAEKRGYYRIAHTLEEHLARV